MCCYNYFFISVILWLYRFIKVEVNKFSVRQINMVIEMILIVCFVWLRVVFVNIEIKFGQLIVMVSEEFLVRFRYWLVSGGMMILSV